MQALRRSVVALAVVVAGLAGASSSSAHLVASPKGASLEARAESQRENLSHARFVCRRGGGEHRAWSCRAVRWLERELGETEQLLEARRVSRLDPRSAIRHVFDPYGQGSAAVSVASCETGGTFDVGASNGQYLGLFQMGEGERSRHGHGSSAIVQARAALSYNLALVAEGRSWWSAWQCLPGGGLRW